MKTIKHVFVLLAIVAVTTLTSCTDSGGYESRTTQNYSNCFHYVYDLSEGESSVFSSPYYTIEWNYGTAEATVTIKNAKFANNMPAVNMTLNDLKWSINSSGYKVINTTDVVPTINGQPMDSYLINQFKIEVLDRYAGAAYEPVVNIYFSVNGRYAVTAVQKTMLFYGNTTTTVNGDAFTTSSPYYLVKIDENLSADMTIYDAQFSAAMPAVDMTLSDVPVVINSGIGFALSGNNLIPLINGSANAGYEIPSLSGNCAFSSGLNLAFVCNVKSTDEDGSEVVTQNQVQAKLAHLPSEE